MAVPIDLPNDPRVQHRYAQLNGVRYHYLYAEPQSGKWRETVFLIHGWPDISAGWRYQIPLILKLECRVVVPDMMGYGGTESPPVPPNDIRLYSLKRAADDIAELARQLGAQTIVLGGHDWGGMVIWRTVLWHPKLVSHTFSVCTPYDAPQKAYRSVEDLVKGPVPQFGYQLHLTSGEVEKRIQSSDDMRQFLKGMFGGRGPKKELAFSQFDGVLFENLPKIGECKLLSSKELEYYTHQYMIHGLHGSLNWYRARRVNFEDDLEIQHSRITIPALFIAASKDRFLKPEMAARMGRHFDNLTSEMVTATHWVLMEAPDEVNYILGKWFNAQVFKDSKSSL